MAHSSPVQSVSTKTQWEHLSKEVLSWIRVLCTRRKNSLDKVMCWLKLATSWKFTKVSITTTEIICYFRLVEMEMYKLSTEMLLFLLKMLSLMFQCLPPRWINTERKLRLKLVVGFINLINKLKANRLKWINSFSIIGNSKKKRKTKNWYFYFNIEILSWNLTEN